MQHLGFHSTDVENSDILGYYTLQQTFNTANGMQHLCPKGIVGPRLRWRRHYVSSDMLNYLPHSVTSQMTTTLK